MLFCEQQAKTRREFRCLACIIIPEELENLKMEKCLMQDARWHDDFFCSQLVENETSKKFWRKSKYFFLETIEKTQKNQAVGKIISVNQTFLIEHFRSKCLNFYTFWLTGIMRIGNRLYLVFYPVQNLHFDTLSESLVV